MIEPVQLKDGRWVDPTPVVNPDGSLIGGSSSGGGDATAANQALQTTELQGINTKLTAQAGLLDGLEGFVDGLEALIAATNALLTTQAGYLDGLEGFVDGLEGAFTTLNAKDFATQTTLAAVLAKIISAPATEAKQDTGNTSLASILAKIIAAPATEATQTALANSIASLLTIAQSTDPSPTTYYTIDVVDTPTVTNGAYSAGDVVGGYRTATLARAADKGISITGVQIACKANVTPNIRVVIFGATPAATLADNAAYTLSAADVLTVRRTLSSLLLGASWQSHGATVKTISLVPPLPIFMKPISGGQTIGYYLIDDTGVTLTSTSDIQVRFSGFGE